MVGIRWPTHRWSPWVGDPDRRSMGLMQHGEMVQVQEIPDSNGRFIPTIVLHAFCTIYITNWSNILSEVTEITTVEIKWPSGPEIFYTKNLLEWKILAIQSQNPSDQKVRLSIGSPLIHSSAHQTTVAIMIPWIPFPPRIRIINWTIIKPGWC